MVGRFFSWWGGQLRSMLPLAGGGDTGQWLDITLEADRVRATMSDQRERVLMDVPRAQGQELAAELGRIAQGVDLQRARCRVWVPVGEVLARDIELPMAAEENLREVLAFEMARKTPFRADDVYFDATVTTRDPARRMLGLRLNVVPRRVLGAITSALAAWSLEPVASPPPSRLSNGDGYAVFAFRSVSFSQRSFGALNLTLGIALIAVLGLCIWLPINAQQQTLEQLQQQLANAREGAGEAMALRDQLDAVQQANTFLEDAKSERPPMVVVLDELTRALPDNTFLTRFQVSNAELNLHGSSQSASELIAILEKLTLLEGVRFASPVTRDTASGGERFHVVGRLVPDASGQANREGDR